MKLKSIAQDTKMARMNTTSLSGVLQRKCRCKQYAQDKGECIECKKKNLQLQRKISGCAPSCEVPSIVPTVLSSAGQPLDGTTRRFMESRFKHDFGNVRIHTDPKANRSAHAVNAQAYTVGNNIVFGDNQFSNHTPVERKLLAHELAHVVQQQASSGTATPASLSNENEASEIEADKVAERVVAGDQSQVVIEHPSSNRLMRRLRVEHPDQRIANPRGEGLDQTNAETAESYLRRLSPQGNVRVNRANGEVTMARGFCRGFLGGLLQGGSTGYRMGHRIGSIGGRIPLFGPIFGAIGALFGGLIGSIGGLFGANISRAASSETPTGSTCICDFVQSRPETVIEINDTSRPSGGAERVRVPSPNSTRQWGSATVSGQLEISEPWLILGHELCGHAWVERHASTRGEGEGGYYGAYSRDLQTGEISLTENYQGQLRRPSAGQFLRHGQTVERENLIRQEHGMQARGRRLRDPYCGEAFWRERGQQDEHWQETGEPEPAMFRTYLDECEFLRSQLPESQNRRYRIDEPIP